MKLLQSISLKNKKYITISLLTLSVLPGIIGFPEYSGFNWNSIYIASFSVILIAGLCLIEEPSLLEFTFDRKIGVSVSPDSLDCNP
ncbi:hypothetical protein BVC80_8771g10 [Macleaya cordata]|uniref:Uncharacterized protein n=1 Tax=Macleaya cordata TaxID=56857 RepID=A0A200QSH4_MACCD|nr:hypothetical protein BVC80_8771g10 [Macleaya cordata]